MNNLKNELKSELEKMIKNTDMDTLIEGSISAKKAAGTKMNKHEQEKKRNSETAKDRMEEFKKKYNYKRDGEYVDSGTILWKGERIPVKFSGDKVITTTAITGDSIYAPNQMLCDLMTGEINIDQKMFKMKKKLDRDLILDHEVGHGKLHRIETDDGKVNTKLMDTAIDQAIMNLGVGNRTLAKGVRQLIKKKLVDKYDDEPNTKVTFDNMRKDCIKLLKKYESGSVGHTDFKEFEADAYALNKNNANPKQLNRALTNYSKVALESPKTGVKFVDKLLDHKVKSDNKKDIKIREKVQNNDKVKELRKNKIYNESVVDLDYFE